MNPSAQRVLAGCPRCGLAPVAVVDARWREGAQDRRSVYVDEPARCVAGCTLGPRDVERLLRGVYERTTGRAGAYQLPLLEAA